MKDRWCRSLELPDGRKLSGGAARNVRLSVAGGVDQVICDVLSQLDERISGGAQAQPARPKSRPARPAVPSKPTGDRPTMH